MFRPLEPMSDAALAVEFFVDGEAHRARAGIPVAAALLEIGHTAFRVHALDGSARGPHCMMGQCFECVVEIDGKPNVQSCLVALAAGMRIVLNRPTTGSKT